MKRILRQITVSALRRLVPKGVRNSLRLWTMLELPDRHIQPILDFSQGPVVTLAPHMDDEAIGPGGTLAMHERAGAKVSVLMLTDGALGDPSILLGNPTAQELMRRRTQFIEVRKNESRRSAQILGISDIQFFDAPDGALQETPELVAKIVDAMVQLRPTVVYAPALTDFHRDHWATNRVLRATLDRVPASIRQNLIIRGYEIWSTLPANRVADITSVIKLKESAIAAFASQTKSVDFVGAALGLNRYRSIVRSQGHGYAEGFFETTVPEYAALFDAMSLRQNAKGRTEFASSEPA